MLQVGIEKSRSRHLNGKTNMRICAKNRLEREREVLMYVRVCALWWSQKNFVILLLLTLSRVSLH